MSEIARSLSLAFASGSVGAAIKLLAVWLFSEFGVNSALGLPIRVTPGIAQSFVHVMTGGLWGIPLCLTWLQRSTLLRGLALGIVVTLWEVMVTLLPGHSVLLGPRFEWRLVMAVLLFNVIWALAAAVWYRFVR